MPRGVQVRPHARDVLRVLLELLLQLVRLAAVPLDLATRFLGGLTVGPALWRAGLQFPRRRAQQVE